jgi:hypothetical protein
MFIRFRDCWKLIEELEELINNHNHNCNNNIAEQQSQSPMIICHYGSSFLFSQLYLSGIALNIRYDTTTATTTTTTTMENSKSEFNTVNSSKENNNNNHNQQLVFQQISKLIATMNRIKENPTHQINNNNNNHNHHQYLPPYLQTPYSREEDWMEQEMTIMTSSQLIIDQTFLPYTEMQLSSEQLIHVIQTKKRRVEYLMHRLGVSPPSHIVSTTIPLSQQYHHQQQEQPEELIKSTVNEEINLFGNGDSIEIVDTIQDQIN